MRILGSIVAPSTPLMSFCDSKITGSGSIRSQIVCDQLVWDKAILLPKLAHEFQRGTLVPPALDPHVKHFALGIHGTPQIDHAAGDFQIDLVKMPGSVGLRSTFAQVRRDHGPEMIHPMPYGLVVLLSQKVAGPSAENQLCGEIQSSAWGRWDESPISGA